MGIGKGGQGWALESPCTLKISAKNVVSLISRGKNQNSPLLTPPWKNFWKNTLVAPPGKNPSDALGHNLSDY